MTTTLASFGILVEDRANNRIMDFYASPISRAKLVGGYISSALFIGFFMCTLTFMVASIYLLLIWRTLFRLIRQFMLVGVILLSVLIKWFDGFSSCLFLQNIKCICCGKYNYRNASWIFSRDLYSDWHTTRLSSNHREIISGLPFRILVSTNLDGKFSHRCFF